MSDRSNLRCNMENQSAHVAATIGSSANVPDVKACCRRLGAYGERTTHTCCRHHSAYQPEAQHFLSDPPVTLYLLVAEESHGRRQLGVLLIMDRSTPPMCALSETCSASGRKLPPRTPSLCEDDQTMIKGKRRSPVADEADRPTSRCTTLAGAVLI